MFSNMPHFELQHPNTLPNPTKIRVMLMTLKRMLCKFLFWSLAKEPEYTRQYVYLFGRITSLRNTVLAFKVLPHVLNRQVRLIMQPKESSLTGSIPRELLSLQMEIWF